MLTPLDIDPRIEMAVITLAAGAMHGMFYYDEFGKRIGYCYGTEICDEKDNVLATFTSDRRFLTPDGKEICRLYGNGVLYARGVFVGDIDEKGRVFGYRNTYFSYLKDDCFYDPHHRLLFQQYDGPLPSKK